VANLPEQFREAIMLHQMNDLSYKESAEVAGVPVGMVMPRLTRASAMLRSARNAAETAPPGPGPAAVPGIAL
jgi:RNA polymerase sigma-70 factor, ECF subfamily